MAARDAIFIQGTIDAYEKGEVAYADMPGAFLHTKTDKKIIDFSQESSVNLWLG